MGIFSSLSIPYSSRELHRMAAHYNLPKRLLSEAQEVLLSRGLNPGEAKQHLKEICESAFSQGGTVQIFHELLETTLSTLPSR